MVMETKALLETARFTVPAGTPYEAVAVRQEAFKNFQDRLTTQHIFKADDILIDAVTNIPFQEARDNPWFGRLPEEVITYCYQLVSFHKISFVMTVVEDGITSGDHVIAIFDDRYVRMGPDYAKRYKDAMSQIVMA